MVACTQAWETEHAAPCSDRLQALASRKARGWGGRKRGREDGRRMAGGGRVGRRVTLHKVAEGLEGRRGRWGMMLGIRREPELLSGVGGCLVAGWRRERRKGWSAGMEVELSGGMEVELSGGMEEVWDYKRVEVRWRNGMGVG